MEPLYFVIPVLLAALLLFGYGVTRSCVQLWAAHRRKLAILKKFERNPGAFESTEDVLDALSRRDDQASRALRQDYAVTGVCLAALGLGAVLIGQYLQYGQIGVGLYIGGIACIALGVAIAFLGYLLRALARPLITRATDQ